MKPASTVARQYGPALECHYQFMLWLVPAMEKLPRAHKYFLGERVQALGLQVLEELISATYSKNRRDSIHRANLGLEKLRFMFRLAKDLRALDVRRYEHAARSLDETGRLVGGWLKTDATHAETV